MEAPTIDQSIEAINNSRPPATDPFHYLTILERHLRTETVSYLQPILEDRDLAQSIGWDLVQILLPIPGSQECLTTIARLGNPREVILKTTEALRLLAQEESNEEDGEDAEIEDEEQDEAVKEREMPLQEDAVAEEQVDTTKPTRSNKFCILVGLLAILHPRIKTKYPSRFLSTSLEAALFAYQPNHEETHAVTNFVQVISVQKRPMLPQRSSSLNSLKLLSLDSTGAVAPDPEAVDESSGETAIQKKLLQSFLTHILEEYVKVNSLEWAARLQEHFEPNKIVPNRPSVGSSYKNNINLQERDLCVGELVARARDLGLSGHKFLFDSLHDIDPTLSEDDSDVDESPTSPEQIPLSKPGCLLLVAYSIFSSISFDIASPLPSISLFPDHAILVNTFIGTDGPMSIGTEDAGIIDSILTIGLWLEHATKFVSGPLADEDFLRSLQSLSLISANCPSPSIRYSAHILTSRILHAHPDDRIRLSFIASTLADSPYENLKVSAVSWLKEEIMIARERQSSNLFSTTLAIASVQPFLYHDFQALTGADTSWEELQVAFPVIMAVINFTIFIGGEGWSGVVPAETFDTADKIFVKPLLKFASEAEVHEESISIEMMYERLVTLQGIIDGKAGTVS